MLPKFITLLLTMLIGAIGSYLFYKMKVPAGALIGAVITVSVFQIITGLGWFPTVFKVGVQAVAGAFVGQRIGKKDITEIRKLIKPALILFFGIAILSLISGFAIYFVSDVDIATALISSTPGGVTDIVLISSDVGADPTQSTVLQLIRYFLAILILPQINVKICENNPAARTGVAPENSSAQPCFRNAAITLLIAGVTGAIGRISKFPAGAIVFSMFFVAAYNVKTGNAFVPKKLRIIAQWVAGISIGVCVSMSDVIGLKYLVFPAVIVVINCLIINYFFGFILYRACGLDLATNLFASVPAGVSDMALISLEQGGDAPKVAILQMVRYICVISVMPSVIKLIGSAIG